MPPSIRFTIWKSTCAVTGELVAASHMPRQNCSTEMTAAVTPATMASREPVNLAKADRDDRDARRGESLGKRVLR